MTNDEGRIGFSIELETAKIQQQIANLQKGFDQMASRFESDGARIDGTVSKITDGLKQLGAAWSLKEFSSRVMKTRGEFQQLEMAFTTMLQSGEKANALMQQLVKTAATTPFDLDGVANGAKQLLAYGVEADNVNATLIRLGDIAAGLSIPLGDLVYLYGTTMAQGRLYTQDLNQFTGRGIPMIQELAKQFGVADSEVKKLVEEGKVGFPEVQKVIESLTDKGGKFGGLMEAQSKTITGQIANIEDAIDMMFNDIGQSQEGIINMGLDLAGQIVENWQKVGEAIAVAVTAYGSYKAVLMAVTAYQTIESRLLGQIAVEKALAAAAGIQLSNAEAMAAAKTKFLTIAQNGLAAALKKVALATIANPYVLAAAAITALVYVIYKCVTADTALEAAQKSLNRALEKTAEAQKKYNEETANAIELAQNDAAATIDRDEALQLLISRYPEIIQKYIDEKGQLHDILALKKEIAEYDGKKQRQETVDTLKKEGENAYSQYLIASKLYNKQSSGVLTQEELDKAASLRSQYATDADTSGTFATLKEIRDFYKAKASTGLKQYNRKLTENKIADFTAEGGALGNMDDKALKALQTELRNDQAERYKKTSIRVSGIDDYLTYDDRKDLLTRVDAMIKARSMPKNTNAGWAAEKKTAYKQALKAYNDFIKDGKGSRTETEYKKELKTLEDNLNTAKKEYDSVKPKSDSDNKGKEQDKHLQAQQEVNEKTKQLILQNNDDKISLMEEGTEKELAEIDNEYKKKLAAIDKQEAEFKKKNKEAGKGDTLTDEQSDALSEARSLAEQEYKKKTSDVQKKEYTDQLQSMRDYLKEYGTFQQQKLAIAEEYAQKINKAQTEGEKASLQKERDSKLSDIEAQALQANIDWTTVFGEFGGMFKDIIAPALEDAKQYTTTDQFKNSDQASQKAIIEAIQQMEQSLGGADKVSFKKLGERITAYQKAQENLKKAQAEYADKYTDLQTAQNTYEETLKTGTDDQKKTAKEAVDAAQADADAAAKNVETMQSLATEAQQTVSDTASGLKASMSNVMEGLQKLSSGSISGAYEGLIQFGKGAESLKGLGKVGEAFGKVSKALESVPIVGWIASVLDLFKDGISDVMSSIVDAVFGAVSGIIDDIFSGDFTVSFYNSLLKGLNNVFDALTFGSGGPAKWFSSSNAARVAKTIEDLTSQNKLLEQAIDDLTDEMEKARGANAINISRRAADMQQQTIDNYKTIAQTQAGYHGAHHSWDYYWDGFSQEQIDRLSAQIGRDWSGDIWDLSPEEMKLLRSNVDMWEQIKNTGEGGYGERVAEKLDDYIDQAGKLEDITDQLYENLTTTTKDNVFDDFLESLVNLANGSEDVFDDIADSWQEMVNKMVVNNIVGAKFQKKLEQWYLDLAELNEARTKGEITDEEYKRRLDELKEQYEGDVKDAQSEIETMRDMGIIKSTDSGSSQDTSSNGFQTMSQDTGEELNGRFTAIQMDTSIIRETLSTIQVNMGTLNQSALAIKQQTEETKNISLMAIDHLENIAKNTHQLYEMNERLGKIEKNTRKI